MRIKNIKKAVSYFRRLLLDPFSKQSTTALKRYVHEILAIINEKIHGLDFTMVYQCDSNEHNNNYSKSPKAILMKIFNDINYNTPHGFMDMGCGKGYVIACATAYPFSMVGGVEYDQELYKICQKNMQILKYDKINIYNCDAKEFDKYADYDIYYFCNPFDETILSVVAQKILETHLNRSCWIYYLNPHQPERQKVITDAGFKLVKVIENENEKYFTVNVYEG